MKHILALLMLASVAFAQTAEKPSGDGSSATPYLIANLNNLYWLSQHSEAWVAGTHIVQTADIDASATSTWNDTTISGVHSYQGFLPIGNDVIKFNGTYQGSGHTITGLEINRPQPTLGLFGYVGASGSITTVGLIGGSVIGFDDIGGLVGINEGTIAQSFVQDSVVSYGSYNIGGLVGTNIGSISKSYAKGYVYGWGDNSKYLGGLVGDNKGAIDNSFVRSEIGISDVSGGLVGINEGTISKSYAVTGIIDHGGNQICSSGLVGNSCEGGYKPNYQDVSSSYWDSTTAKMTNDNSGTGLTDAQMKVASNFTGFDFTNDWYMPTNGYPQLRAIIGMYPTTPSGNGSSATPYLIANLNNLYWLSQHSEAWSTGKYIEQTADIDASVTSSWDEGAGFSPIGDASKNFFGSYQGGGHKITGLVINRANTDYVGLFGYVGTGGSVTALGLINGSVTGTGTYAYVGSLAGENDGTISASYTTGSVSATGASSIVGGLVGKNLNGSISICYATGTVTGNGGDVGGFVGLNNEGTISSSYATGAVTGTTEVGGFAGDNYGTTRTSYATGVVTGTGYYVYGFAGYNGGEIGTNYWDNNTTTMQMGSNRSSEPNNPIGLSTSDMMDSTKFSAEFRNSGDWVFYQGHTYPLLREFLKPLSITAADVSKTYDGATTTPSVTYAPASFDVSHVQGELAFTGDAASATSAGSYSWIPTGLWSDQQGYQITNKAGTLNIAQRSITIAADTATKVYGEADPDTLAYTITAGSMVNSDVFTGALARDPGENVSLYAIKQGDLALNANYVITFVGNHLSITPHTLTVVADAKTKRTKVADPVFTYTVTNFVSSDDSASILTGTLNREVGDTAGTYTILSDNLKTNANYTIAYTSALLTILANQLPSLSIDTLVVDSTTLHGDLAGLLSTVDADNDTVKSRLAKDFASFSLSNDSLLIQPSASVGDTTLSLQILLDDGRDTVTRTLVVVLKFGSTTSIKPGTNIVFELHKDQALEAIAIDGRRLSFANYAAAVAALPKGVYVLRQGHVAMIVRMRE